jgi:hypothetical protein
MRYRLEALEAYATLLSGLAREVLNHPANASWYTSNVFV